MSLPLILTSAANRGEREMTATDLESLCQLRNHIEAYAARRAAECVKKSASCAGLARSLAEMKLATKKSEYDAFHRADWQLHKEIMLLANTETLLQVWEIVAGKLEDFVTRTLQECFPDLRTLLHEHVVLVESICLGEANAAEDAASIHMEGVWYRLAQQCGSPLTSGDPLQRALAFIAYNYAHPLRLAVVARTVAYSSAGHLSRLFRDEYGIGFQQYVQKFRMEKAAELLVSSNLSIGHIAKRVGYTDLSHFGQHFKRHYRKPPRVYRSSRRPK